MIKRTATQRCVRQGVPQTCKEISNVTRRVMWRAAIGTTGNATVCQGVSLHCWVMTGVIQNVLLGNAATIDLSVYVLLRANALVGVSCG